MAAPGGVTGTIQLSRYFHTSSRNFKTNRSTKGVICYGCLSKEASDKYLAQASDAAPYHSQKQFEEQLKANVPEHTGDNSTLYFKKDAPKQLAHLVKCENVALATRNLAAVDLRMLHRQCVDPITGKVVKYRPTSELTPAPVQPAPASITIDPTLISNQTIENPFYGVSYGSNGTPTTSGTGWTAEKRRQFAADMLRLLIAINAAYMSVEHPYWRHFFSVWVPGCTVPTRADVSGQVLDEEADRVTKIMKDEVEGHYGTGQSDGWKSEAKEALVGSMVNVEYKPWPLNLFPITGEKKTAMNLLNIVLSEISYCVNTLGIRLVAYCTDSGGDAAKMRKMLFAKFPYLIVIACWAHQVNLILGDFFKRNRELKEFLNQALAVVKWFNNHSVARGILGRWQTKVGLFTVLILILPCATRWTSYYNATKRLLKVEHAIRRAVRDDATRAELLACAGNKKEAKEQAAKVICTVEDDSFWDGLHLLLGVLKPMALASHATQTDHAHLGVVFGSLVRLYWSFSLPKLWKRQDMHEPIRNSIQKRFENTEYELLVLAILLNPYLRKAPFRDGSPFSSFAGCYELFERAYSRLVRERPNLECRAAFRSYILEEPGPWSAKNMGLDEAKRRAALEDKPINLVHLWREFDTKGDNGRNGLVRVALILHSAVANSAATERYFSALGTICSKLRTRLLPERMRKTVLVKRQVNADFPKQSKRQRRQTAGSWANTGDADMQGDEEFIAEPFIATSSSAASGEADFGQPSTQSGRSNAASFSQASPSPSLDASTVNALVGAGMLDRSAIDQFTAATGTSAGMFDEEALRLTQDALAAERLEAETAEFMSTAVHEHPMRYSVQDFALPNLLDLSGYPDKPCHGLKLLLEFFDSGKGSLDGERDFLESVTQSVTT